MHFPDWREGNFYQGRLAEAQRRQGFDVSFSDRTGGLFPFLRSVRKSRPDILHFHWIDDIAGQNDLGAVRSLARQFLFRLDLLLTLRLLQGRLVWTVHNLRSHDCRHPRADRAAHLFLARAANRLFAHSPLARDQVVQTFGIPAERVVVTPHGNLIGCYADTTTRIESRERLAIDEDRFTFLYFGHVRPYKGLEALLSSFAELSDPRKLLIVAGRAPDRGYAASIRQMVSSSAVVFLDEFIPDEELQFLFHACDVVVLPFRDVLTSGSLLLAMSFGRMVIAPKLGSVPDYAPASENVLYDPAISGSLSGALRSAAGRDVEGSGRRNLEAVRRFTWEDAASRTTAVYRELMAATGDREVGG